MADTFGCEPLRVWCRLEQRARMVDLDHALRAEIADPQWMLGRQWQFGEFKGEDTGSAVLAKLAVQTTKLHSLRARSGGEARDYSDRTPLEVSVEAEPLHLDLRARARAGQKLLALLDAAGAEHDAGNGAPPYDRAHYLALFRQLFAFELPAAPPVDTAELLERTRFETNADAQQVLAALTGRGIDAARVLAVLPASGALDWSVLPGDLALGVIAGHADLVLSALTAFRDLFRARWQPAGDPAAWDPSALEYRFSAELPHPNGGTLQLSADEYASGRLDWYSFDAAAYDADLPGDAVTTEVATAIPAPAEFAGMPHPRWWQLEDGDVNLGHIQADTTDVAKMVVAEFALLFGNNWFVHPWSQERGTLAQVQGIVVTDVFGQRTLVRSAVNAEPSWSRWDFFSLSLAAGVGSIGEHLFVPPAVGLVDEDEPLEQVALIRDEMANLVWGVERAIPDLLGGGRNGNDAARVVRNAIVRSQPAPPPDPQGLRYELGGSVPENWIPFMAVHKPLEDRAVRLQRASMPRFLAAETLPIRPRTRLLRAGIDGNDRQTAPYFVHEEEVPRTGVIVEASHQRTRWYGGTTFVWLGRKKRRGAGEGGSGLGFDRVLEPKVP